MKLLDELVKLTKPFDEDDYDFDFSTENDAYVDEPTLIARPESASRGVVKREKEENPFYAMKETSTAEPSSFEESAGNRATSKEERVSSSVVLRVRSYRPLRFEQAAEIADGLKNGCTAVVNLEGADRETTRRLLDFLSGVAYANGGSIKKAAISTFIITPYPLDITGDLVDEMENTGF